MQLLTNRIRQYLDQNDIPYKRIPHRRDVTARQTAADCHLKPGDFAKVVGLNSDGAQILAVLPADHYIDVPRFKDLLGAGHLELLHEDAMATFFPDCETGACPPLGNLYGLTVYVAPILSKHEMITFNAGTHEEAIQMSYAEFKKLVQPIEMDFAFPSVDFSEAKAK